MNAPERPTDALRPGAQPVQHATLRSVFAQKYESPDQDWGRASGPGSEPYYNLPYRAFLESFLRLNAIGSVVDIGCGDWQFSRLINWDGVDYCGVDVVGSVIFRNLARFKAPNIRFTLAPEALDELPSGDLLIMKDVLQHLPTAEILRYRDEVFPRYRFCLITNSYQKLHTPRNIDVPLGGFRCLDLTEAPFAVKGAHVVQFATGAYEELRTLLIQRD